MEHLTPKLKVCAWLWGDKYSQDYVRKWHDGVNRHLTQPHELFVITPDPADLYLTEIRGCFARLRMFDQAWQHRIGLKFNERLVCTDLDVVFTGPLDPLFDSDDEFTIVGGANSSNPCPHNGSMMMLRAGHHHDVWYDFSLESAAAVPFYEFPDDQAWLHHKFPRAATWQVGPSSGIYSFQKRGWPGNDVLPEGARCVIFPGWRDPAKFTNLQWIRENWG